MIINIVWEIRECMACIKKLMLPERDIRGKSFWNENYDSRLRKKSVKELEGKVEEMLSKIGEKSQKAGMLERKVEKTIESFRG